MTHPAALPSDELLKDCSVERTRRSGPGGQHRNKVETAIVLTHRPTGIHAEASERRSQAENLAVATFRLRVRLALDFRRQLIDAEPPSELWRSRCRNGRISISPENKDFPALLSEALDALSDRHWNIATSAEQLGCTTSQLAKFLQLEPLAFAMLNRERASRGERPLKP